MTLNFNTSEVLLKQDLFASLSHNAGTNTDRNEFIVNWNLQYLRDQYRNHRVFLCLQNGIFIQRVTNDNANNNKSLIFTADNLRFKNRKRDINFFYGADEPNILTFLRMGNRPVVNANREAENDHNRNPPQTDPNQAEPYKGSEPLLLIKVFFIYQRPQT